MRFSEAEAGGGWQLAVASWQKAEAEGRRQRQKAEGRRQRQKAEGRRQKAEGRGRV